MAGPKKILRNVAGIFTEIVGIVTSAGAANDGDVAVLDSTGRFDTSVMPVGIGPVTQAIVASEALSAGDFVSIWNSAGTIKVRKADAATTGKDADGFVLAAVSSAGTATVYTDDINTQLTGLTAGTDYFLSDTTPGGVTSTAVSGAGKTSQFIGEALSATSIRFRPGPPITLA